MKNSYSVTVCSAISIDDCEKLTNKLLRLGTNRFNPSKVIRKLIQLSIGLDDSSFKTLLTTELEPLTERLKKTLKE